MRRILAVAVALAGCKKTDDAPAAPAPKKADYCRAANTFTSVPMSTMSGSSVRPAHTFSIVARDPATGDLGVAVQSHWFSVGALVTWAEAGVGAVATQSFVEPSYGPKGLALMRDGTPAPDAMKQLIAADKSSDVRQLGFVDAQGRAATHTGAKCIQFASGIVGDGFAVQSNLMGNDKVTPAMAKAFAEAKGDLGDRLLAALDAGQAVGGDIRGCQSAAILVVSGKKTDTPWAEKKLDLRVEDSPEPLVELRRLVKLARAYDRMNQGDLAVEKGDMKAAEEHYGAAAAMVPDVAEMVYWQAVALADHGQVDKSIPLFKRAFADDSAWIELTRRLQPAGLIHDGKVVDRILDAK
jgi:uncharacterized Ntn-hydrolase superfamily protein